MCLLRAVIGRRARKSELVLCGEALPLRSVCFSPCGPEGAGRMWASDERRVAEALGKGRHHDGDSGQDRSF